LRSLELLREARAGEATLAARVYAIKAYQHARFATYADLLAPERYAPRRAARAAGLDELQSFLEMGFSWFGAMGGASDAIARR
jgi:hypothetical protein